MNNIFRQPCLLVKLETTEVMDVLPHLKALRKETGISQQRLAEALGISQQSVNQYENYKIEPDIDTLSRLADYFHTTVDYIIGRTDNRWPGDSTRDARLNPDETEIIRLYRQLGQSGKDCAAHVLRALNGK